MDFLIEPTEDNSEIFLSIESRPTRRLSNEIEEDEFREFSSFLKWLLKSGSYVMIFHAVCLKNGMKALGDPY